MPKPKLKAHPVGRLDIINETNDAASSVDPTPATPSKKWPHLVSTNLESDHHRLLPDKVPSQLGLTLTTGRSFTYTRDEESFAEESDVKQLPPIDMDERELCVQLVGVDHAILKGASMDKNPLALGLVRPTSPCELCMVFFLSGRVLLEAYFQTVFSLL